VQQYVVSYVATSFEKECNVVLTYSKAHFSLIRRGVLLQKVVVHSRDGHEIVSANRCIVQCAAIDSFIFKRFVIHLTVDGLCMAIDCLGENWQAIKEFLHIVFMAKNEDILVSAATVNNFSVEQLGRWSLAAKGRVRVKKKLLSEHYKLVFGFDQSCATVQDKTLWHASSFHGTYRSWDMARNAGHGSFHVPTQSGDRTLVAECSQSSHGIMIKLREDGTANRCMAMVSGSHLVYQGAMNLDDLVSSMVMLCPYKRFEELVSHHLTQALNGMVRLKGGFNYMTGEGFSRLSGAAGKARAQVNIVHTSQRMLLASLWHYRDFCMRALAYLDPVQKKYRGLVFNNTACGPFLKRYTIHPQGLFLSWRTTPTGTFVGRYGIGLHKKNRAHQSKNISGIIAYDGITARAAAFSGQYRLYANGHMGEGRTSIDRLMLFDRHDNLYLSCTSSEDDHTKLSGEVVLGLIYPFLPTEVQSYLAGDSSYLAFTIDQQDLPNNLSGTIGLKRASFTAPGFYNALQSATCSYQTDIVAGVTLVNDLALNFSTGSVGSSQARITWDRNGLRSAIVPFTVDQLLVSRYRGAYAVVDGSFSYQWHAHALCKLTGECCLKRGRITYEKALSQSLQGRGAAVQEMQLSTLVAAPVTGGLELDLACTTQEPIAVSAPDVSTKVSGSIRLMGTYESGQLSNPSIHGAMRLHAGTCKVLGRALHITKGVIDFVPSQPDNPLIDIAAHAHIKRYKITIHISGQARKPTVLLESSPPLTHEQIMGLFLSGSESNDVTQQLPSIFLQHAGTIMEDSSRVRNRLVRALLRPLKYIQVLPYQDDVSAQKSVRARLHVDLSPHLRALLHKDLWGGSEDFSLQVEYDVSDELNVKLLRESSGDLGAEAEVRVKFS
jgi:hypothetical protein